MPTRKNYRNPMAHFNRFTGAPGRMNGHRANKSSHPNDFFPGPGKHTKPVEFTNVYDTGVSDPSRRRHKRTKEMHAKRRAETS